MNIRLLLVALIGVLAIHLWGFGFGAVFYQLYLFVGSPDHPTPLQWYPSMVAVSLLFGLVGALPARFLVPQAGASTAIVFLAAATLSMLLSTLFFAGVPGIFAQLASYGFWSFLLGSLIAFSVRRRVAA